MHTILISTQPFLTIFITSLPRIHRLTNIILLRPLHIIPHLPPHPPLPLPLPSPPKLPPRPIHILRTKMLLPLPRLHPPVPSPHQHPHLDKQSTDLLPVFLAREVHRYVLRAVVVLLELVEVPLVDGEGLVGGRCESAFFRVEQCGWSAEGGPLGGGECCGAGDGAGGGGGERGGEGAGECPGVGGEGCEDFGWGEGGL